VKTLLIVNAVILTLVSSMLFSLAVLIAAFGSGLKAWAEWVALFGFVLGLYVIGSGAYSVVKTILDIIEDYRRREM
jgi:hypothetical protein